MGTLTMETIRPEVGVRAAKTSPVIVATDGRDQSDAALVAAGMLAGSADGLRVVTVLKPMPIVSPEAQLSVSPDVEASRRAEAKRAVKEQLVRVWNVPLSAEVEVHDGDPATMIAKVAHESNASMIVSGLGRHRVMDRLFGDETALRLIRVAAVPVQPRTLLWRPVPLALSLLAAVERAISPLRPLRLLAAVARALAQPLRSVPSLFRQVDQFLPSRSAQVVAALRRRPQLALGGAAPSPRL